MLVPDVVYLPRTANDATATLLARKVLGGPTAVDQFVFGTITS